MTTHKRTKLALDRESLVELRPHTLAAIHGGAAHPTLPPPHSNATSCPISLRCEGAAQ